MIYLDNSATTRPYKEVLDLYTKISYDYFGNPSSLHSLGMEAEQVLNHARKKIARFLQCRTDQLLFTSGGTEANVLAIRGVVSTSKRSHIITTTVEHASVYENIRQLEKEGHDVTYIQADSFGRVTVKQVEDAIQKNTTLVSIGYVQGELGTIQPIEEIVKLILLYPRIHLHVDAIQSLLKVPMDPDIIKSIDFMTLSAHKIHGTKGTGVLYARNPSVLTAVMRGGNQEQALRPGTEHLAGVACFAKALEMGENGASKNHQRLHNFRDKLHKALASIEGVSINSPEQDGAPHILNMSIPKIKAEVLVQSLSKEGIYVSTQSACSTKTGAPSRILLGVGHDHVRAETAIRVSMSFLTTEEEITTFIQTMKRLVPSLQEVY